MSSILKKAIANQTATEDKKFNFIFAANTFNDVDTGDSLTYGATLAAGLSLVSDKLKIMLEQFGISFIITTHPYIFRTTISFYTTIAMLLPLRTSTI
ncbi:MAG: hypothetical protein KME09_20195 [Pleurocapsa minor HA4230-MV1]|nr:hypothetical protein [Pleurocapsa minor HA4230-MV1]